MAVVGCADLPDEQKDWFTNSGGRAYIDAKRICNTKCDVREECLARALEFESDPYVYERNHIWGGMTAAERDREFGRVINRGAPDPLAPMEDDLEAA